MVLSENKYNYSNSERMKLLKHANFASLTEPAIWVFLFLDGEDPCNQPLERSLHIFVSECVYEGIQHGCDHSIEKGHHLSPVLGGRGRWLQVHVDSSAVEKGHHD